MTRLRQLPGRLGAGLAARIKSADVSRDHLRDRAQAWRRWYKTSAWQRLRWRVLVRDRFTCQICGRVEHETSQLVADHRAPHRGDEALFWDEDNLQCLCKPCHDGIKQRQERQGW